MVQAKYETALELTKDTTWLAIKGGSLSGNLGNINRVVTVSHSINTCYDKSYTESIVSRFDQHIPSERFIVNQMRLGD